MQLETSRFKPIHIAVCLLLSILLACKKKPLTEVSSEKNGAVATDPANLRDYWSRCKKKIGPFPPLTCKSGRYNIVRDGITWKGEVVEFLVERHHSDGSPDGNYRFVTGRDLLDSNNVISPENGTCRRPSFISEESGQCIPGNRLMWFTAHVPNIGDVQWSGFCRNEYPRPDGAPFYEVISLIGHAPETGDTCFFESELNAKPSKTVSVEGQTETRSLYFGENFPKRDVWTEWLEKKRANSTEAEVRLAEAEIRSLSPVADPGRLGWALPSPEDPEAASFYISPKTLHTFSAACHLCHTTSPWVRNPFITSAEETRGIYSLLPNTKAKKYNIVAFNELVGPENVDSQAPKQLVQNKNDPAYPCTTCHSIGNLRYCRDLVPLALGMTHDGPFAPHFHAKTATYLSRVLKARAPEMQKFPASGVHYGFGDDKRFRAFGSTGAFSSEEKVFAMGKAILDCCSQEGSVSCVWENVDGWSQ